MKKYYLNEVSEKVGVSKRTIIRWEKRGWIKPAPRDYKGWRVYDEALLSEITQFKNKETAHEQENNRNTQGVEKGT